MASPRTSRRPVTAALTAALAATVGTVVITTAALPAQAAPRPSAPAGQGTVVGAERPDAVKDSYIVTLRPGTSPRSAAGTALVARYGGTVQRVYTAALSGYALTLPADAARRLAADPAVEQVVQDSTVHADATQYNPPSWGLDRIDQAKLPLDQKYTYPDSAGAGATVYVVDTGVRISHRDFGGRAVNGYDLVDDDAVAEDGNGHGTHVASTVAGVVAGVAKKAKVVAVRVLDANGSGSTSGVIAGIDWVTKHHSGPSVANLSLGGGANTALDTAVRNSIKSGVTYAVAAGNSASPAQNYSPARVAEALTVGSVDEKDNQSSSSNYGSAVDLFAPGVRITGAWHTDDGATNTISGTSMAAPHVAGAAAIYAGLHPSANAGQVSKAVLDGATKDVVHNPGPGTPNRLLRVIS
ncbi:S8 family peptidase [Streptomyces sp. HSW2009]|uniref:S8 family peptidase n=1 Tax=Streptomyces sp. HSW2009 TaxID=3142890 RepID=UPI0032ED0430